MTNQIRNEEHQTYDIYTGLPLDGFELFSDDEKFTLLEAQRIIEEKYLRESEALRSPELTKRFLQARLATESSEVFGVLWLDNRHRTIRVQDLFNGTIDGAAVYPREVVKHGLMRNASAAIFFHNHPSGVAEPSQSDVTLTKRLKDALALVDIRILDHFVVAGNDTVSLAERGML